MSTPRTITHRSNLLSSAVLTAVAALTLGPLAAGCLPALDTPALPPADQSPTSTPAALAALPVAPEDTTAPYDREAWGDWASHGRGCDTRELVLADQGTGMVPGTACRPVCPATGPACWHSPYDGAALRDPARVHIDHRVPLAEAVRSGAAEWTREQRERFYNDPTNLVAASARSNTSKGDDDPARWRPADRAVWCGYATAYVSTKATYRLSVDHAERDALAAMLATCPRQHR